MGILNKIKQYLPVTKKELREVLDMMMDVLDAVESADKQHSNIERSLISQLTQSEETEKKDTSASHVEFG